MTLIISGERSIGYDEIHARIARAATGFRALGLRGGAPVAMMLRNDFAFFEVSGGAAALGSPVVPINWHLKAEEVGYILADSGADILVCHADLLPQIQPRPARHLRLLVVATPPEIAAAFGIAPALTQVPRRNDGLGLLARQPRAVAGAAGAQLADVLYLRHHRHAEGSTPQADAARTARGVRARRRHRLWHQAEG